MYFCSFLILLEDNQVRDLACTQDTVCLSWGNQLCNRNVTDRKGLLMREAFHRDKNPLEHFGDSGERWLEVTWAAGCALHFLIFPKLGEGLEAPVARAIRMSRVISKNIGRSQKG